jgi:subtilisin family serine protease
MDKKALLASVCGLVFLALIVIVPVTKARTGTMPSYVPGEVLVKFIEGEGPDAAFLQKHGLKSAHKVLKAADKKDDKADKAARKYGLDQLQVLELDSAASVEDAVRDLSADPAVVYAEPNYIVSTAVLPNDPYFSKLWGLNNAGQLGGMADVDIDAVSTWDSVHDTTVVVGIIDTGIDYTHEDITDNMWRNPGEVPDNGIDDDSNGYVDDVYGWNFITETNNPMDDNGHGTHVAGTIAGVGNNGIGIAGVAWVGKVAALKFLGASGFGTTEDAVQAIAYANSMGFKITNNSWGGGPFSQALHDVIAASNDAGSVFVAAAGNSGVNIDTSPSYPAAYDVPSIISVAATDQNDTLAIFSNYGAVSVDLSAPGVKVYSSVPRGTCELCDATGYRYLNGTSMATPHVAGAAALILAANPGMTNSELRSAILGAVDPVPALSGKTVTGGRLSLGNLFPPSTDTLAPAAIQVPSVVAVTDGSVTLAWTATGDDGMAGQAAQYDVRYAVSPIVDNASFAAAQHATAEPIPGTAGSAEQFTVGGLFDETAYYFAVRAVDEEGNYSSVSNGVSTTTLASTSKFTLLSNSFEAGAQGWITAGVGNLQGLWHLETHRAASPNTSWAYNSGTPVYDYEIGRTSGGTLTSPLIDLRGQTNASVRFSYYYETESEGTEFDQRTIWVGVGGVFTKVHMFSQDTMNEWHQYELDLTPYVGQQIQVRFMFETKDAGANNFEGWYIDDVLVRGDQPLPVDALPEANAGADKTGAVLQAITFVGSGSDAEGPIATYRWDFGDGTSATTATATKTYQKGGVYTATLTVTDGRGQAGYDSATVTVSPDTVQITKATYSTSKKELTVEAKSSLNNQAALTVAGIGSMTYNKGVFKLIKVLPTNPGSVTVTSSLGGSRTLAVTVIR